MKTTAASDTTRTAWLKAFVDYRLKSAPQKPPDALTADEASAIFKVKPKSARKILNKLVRAGYAERGYYWAPESGGQNRIMRKVWYRLKYKPTGISKP